MSNIYEGRQSFGTFAGSVLAMTKDGIGGFRHVFYSPDGGRIHPVHPLYGGVLVNPFPGHGKIYAGDLIEHTLDGECKLLKSYEIMTTSGDTDTTYAISSGACAQGEVFRHIPFVGDNIMVAPSTLSEKGKAVTVTAVVKTYDAKGKQNGWNVTVSETLGKLNKGDVLVEASKAGTSVQAMVTNPNCYAEGDYDCPFVPATGDEDFDGARYFFTPAMMYGMERAYISRMQPLPASILSLEKFKTGYKEFFKL